MFSTNSINNSRDPYWATTFYVNHNKKEGNKQPTFILVKIFDSEFKEDGDYNEIASGIFELSSILSTEGTTNTKYLKGGGTIDVYAKQAEEELCELHLKMSGNFLKNARGKKKKSNLFYQFSRMGSHDDDDDHVIRLVRIHLLLLNDLSTFPSLSS